LGFPRYNPLTNGLLTTSQNELLQQTGYRFTTHYSTANLGGMTSPDDMIQLHYTTPAESNIGLIHMEMVIMAAEGAIFKLTEAPTGGLENPTGTLLQPSLNRALAAEPEPPVVNLYYNASAATGGTVLKETHIGQPSGHPGVYSSAKLNEEWILRPETTYALSLYSIETIAASITLFGSVY